MHKLPTTVYDRSVIIALRVRKLVLIGDSGVGKTSILMRFTTGSFTNEIGGGTDFKTRNLQIDGKEVKLSLWDTAGQERYSYYRGAHGVILVYDVGEPNSFSNLRMWQTEKQRFANQDACQIILGNKEDSDITDARRLVPPHLAREYAASLGVPLFLTSARDNLQIDEAFLHLVRRILATAPPAPAANLGGLNINQSSSSSSGGCCSKR